jgi:HD superfamily phosphohydrolase
MHLREWAEEQDGREITKHFNVIIAALLHDVGHGPFSHSFEQVLKQYKWAPDHEDWTATLISSPNAEIHKALKACTIVASQIASMFAKPSKSGLPRLYRQIVSSQLDVDRMDYLIRDSHFAGVAIGRFDAHYLINSMVIVNHGSDKTLGLTPKGVKAYEAFLLARQLMNRTVYHHHNVKVLEFMIEHLLRLTIRHNSKLTAHKKTMPFIPPYFRRVAAVIKSGGMSKEDFMEQGLNDYVRLTEDVLWTLVSALADSNAVPAAQPLAQRILTRDILPHFMVERGKKELLKESLIRAGYLGEKDFHLVDLTTTMYKGSGDEHVFVLDWDGDVKEISEHSDTISTLRDRPEAETLLIIIDTTKRKRIESLATKNHFIISR